MSAPATPVFLPAPGPASPERTRLVEAARSLYLEQGIAEVSMADVARYLRLQESVVHQWFADKSALVAAVVDAHAQAIYQELRGYQAQCSTAVEELLALRNWASAEMGAKQGAFFGQLQADYPASQQRWQQHMAGFPVEHLRANLHWGIAQALYHPGLAVEELVARWFAQTDTLRAGAATGLSMAERHRALLEQFMADIVTPGGALVARRLQEAYPFY